MIIIGLGSGRSGTKSLTTLLNAQPCTAVFHEVNPSSMAWEGAELTVDSQIACFNDSLNNVRKSISIDRTVPYRGEVLPTFLSDNLKFTGDVASYYLPYAQKILSENDNVVMPCIKRNKEKTVESFIKKLEPSTKSYTVILKLTRSLSFFHQDFKFFRYRNHWYRGPETRLRQADRIWDRLHPNLFDGLDLRKAVEVYWDYYYSAASELEQEFPNKFRIFDLDDFNNQEGQGRVLSFCGYDAKHFIDNAHSNRAKK